MKKLISPLLAAAIFAAMSLSAHAQTKIGTVDMNKIFSSYYKTKDAETRINEARSSAKRELDDRMDTYKKSVDAINKLNQDIENPALSKDAKETKSKQRDDKIAETKNLEREIGEFRQSREKQLQEQAVRMRNGIVDEITKLVQEKVKAENFDLVLDRSGQSLNGVPILLYARDTMDFSDEIITQLNKNKPKDQPAGGAGAASTPKK